MTEPTPPQDETPPVALPTDTTPTWEIELLISLALAFASWQLPGLFDDAYASWRPRLPREVAEPVMMAFIFGKALGTVLAGTFGLHILLRGLWAAALGLHSVYPKGIDWDAVKSGPYFKAEARRIVAPLPQFISRLDNRASIVFAVGGILLMMTVVATMFSVISFAISRGIALVVGDEISPLTPFFVLTALAAAPTLIGSQLDKRFGGRWAPNSRGGRVLKGLAKWGSSSGLTRLVGPMLLVFTSRTGEKKGTLVILGVLYAALALVFVQVVLRDGIISFEGYRYLADDGEEVVLPVHYADQRIERLRNSTRPFLPSEQLQGATARFFVPWRMAAFDGAVKQRCGKAEQVARSDADTAAQRRARRDVVACLGAALDLRLDGEPVTSPWWSAVDGPSELRGLLTQVPIATLPEGRHVLSMAWLVPPRANSAKATGPPTQPAREEVVFWIDRQSNNQP